MPKWFDDTDELKIYKPPPPEPELEPELEPEPEPEPAEIPWAKRHNKLVWSEDPWLPKPTQKTTE